MKTLYTALAFLAALAVTVPVAILAILILAGPHGGLLPHWLHPAVIGLGWLLVGGVPAFVARLVWVRLSRPKT